jgi:hypothetical protein
MRSCRRPAGNHHAGEGGQRERESPLGRGAIPAELDLQGRDEHAEGVDSAQRHLDQHGTDHHHPAIAALGVAHGGILPSRTAPPRACGWTRLSKAALIQRPAALISALRFAQASAPPAASASAASNCWPTLRQARDVDVHVRLGQQLPHLGLVPPDGIGEVGRIVPGGRGLTHLDGREASRSVLLTSAMASRYTVSSPPRAPWNSITRPCQLRSS